MKKTLSLLLAGALLGSLSADAIIAKRGLHSLPQPDGTTVQAQIVGDENGHYYLSADGLPMLDDAEGYLRYATLDNNGKIKLSDFRAAQVSRTAQAREFVANTDMDLFGQAVREGSRPRNRLVEQSGMGRFRQTFPTKGKVKGLVILVEYSDVKFVTSNANTYFTQLLNAPGFNSHGGTGSAKDWFMDNSKDQFEPTFDVYGPVTLPNNRKYYGGNVGGGDAAAEEMVIDAAKILDPTVDFSQYDMDGDGYVDNVYVFYAGRGEADGGGSDCVWPHNYQLTYGGYPASVHDGVKIDCYACSNEWDGSKPDGIGTFVHEFSHVIGLPDLYHTTSSTANYTPGSWSVLDYGPYNNNGRTPPNYSAYERNAIGWIDPILLDGPTSVSLRHIAEANECCIIQTEKKTEFFLLENRQKSGWDAYLPGHGMLIWHIDYVPSVFNSNVVNNTQSHQYVDIVEANNRVGTTSTALASYPWPGSARKTEFTSETTPALKSWAGKAIDVPVTNITETAAGVITFDVCGGAFDLGTPASLTATGKNDGTAVITWKAVERATGYYLTILNGQQHLAAYNHIPTGNVTTVTATGLPGDCTLTVEVSASAGSLEGDPATATLTMPALDFPYHTPQVTTSEVSEKGFTLTWNPLPNAVDYLVHITGTTGGNDATTAVCDMGSGSGFSLPSGWTSSVTTNYTTNNYFGTAKPSLKLANDGENLTTPVFPGQIDKVTFWNRGASTNNESSLEIQVRADENSAWATFYTLKPLNATKGQVYTVDGIAADVRQLRFVYHKAAGNCALDDVTVYYRPTAQAQHPDYNMASVGNVTTHRVTSMMAGVSEYTATVTGVDAQGRKSQQSEGAKITVSANSAVADIVTAPTATVAVNGRCIVYTGTPGVRVTIVTPYGTTVAAADADASGVAAVIVPTPGMYIVSAPGTTAKVAVR